MLKYARVPSVSCTFNAIVKQVHIQRDRSRLSVARADYSGTNGALKLDQN